jgi:hypothetical protein
MEIKINTDNLDRDELEVILSIVAKQSAQKTKFVTKFASVDKRPEQDIVPEEPQEQPKRHHYGARKKEHNPPRQFKTWTKDETFTALTMQADGKDDRKIADSIGRTEASVYSLFCQLQNPNAKISKPKKAAISKFKKLGNNVSHVKPETEKPVKDRMVLRGQQMMHRIRKLQDENPTLTFHQAFRMVKSGTSGRPLGKVTSKKDYSRKEHKIQHRKIKRWQAITEEEVLTILRMRAQNKSFGEIRKVINRTRAATENIMWRLINGKKLSENMKNALRRFKMETQ